MIELDDCGRKLHLKFMRPGNVHHSDVNVVMVIKEPRGTMALFSYMPHGHWFKPTKKHCDNQVKTVKAFMRRHKDD